MRAARAETTPTARPQNQLGSWELVRPIGEGRLARVYQARPAAGSADQLLPGGGIGWDGGTGTTWRSSLRSGVTGILFTQREVTSPVPAQLVEDFWAGLNAATAAR